MKTRIITAAIAALAMLGATPSAEARPHHKHKSSSYTYISGHRSCGTPIYTERYLVGYDRCGNPVWRYRVVEAPRHYRPAPPPRRHHQAPVCPPPRASYGSYRNGGIVIQGSFRL